MATIIRYPDKTGMGIEAPPLSHESEEYRRAAEYHAGARDFSAAAWYTQMYRLYAPDPPDSSVEVELDWSESK